MDDLVCCSFCDSKSMVKIIDFGKVALAGGFLLPDQFTQEKTYPLRLFFCENCYAVQVIDKVNESILFKDYFYFSSAIETLRKHFKTYAIEIANRFLGDGHKSVLEFGCNDGVLLKPLADLGVNTLIGVDPASNVVSSINDSRIKIINNFFNESVANEVIENYGKVDVVLANNVYAHIPDMKGITRAIFKVLADDGVFIFEVHYLGSLIDELQYDMIYHEHLYYHSLVSLAEFFKHYGLVIFDVKPVPTHGGSMRFYVCKEGSKHSASVSADVIKLENKEIAAGFKCKEVFIKFASEVDVRKSQLLNVLNDLKSQGKTIAGYGASGRANTMLQYCGINQTQMSYMIDDAPAKWGYYTPGTHFKIYPSSIIGENTPPDYLLLFAWSFYDEISKKCSNFINEGGKMIVPLPDIKII